jgi:NADH:ubiquinone oxidoreductase subunit E
MSDEERSLLVKLITSYEDDFLGVDQTSLLACLKDIQSTFGIIPEEALGLMSTQLKTSPAILRGLILRSPSLRTETKVHTITLCNGERCSNRGAEAFIRSVEKALGTTVGSKTKDGRFELKTQRCLHRCEFGINVNIDASEHTQMTLEKLLSELKKI